MRRLSIFDGKGKNWGRTEFRWVDFSPRVQGFFSCTAAFAANRPCVPLRMPTRPSFFRHRPRLPSAFAANQPCTLFRVPTRPSFPVPGRVPRPHLRQTSPARPSTCRRGYLPTPSAASPGRICGKTPSHLTPRADAALFIRKRTDFPAASAFRIAPTVLFPQMRPRKKKILASAVKNPPDGILSGPIFPFSVNYRQTLHIQSFPVLPRKIIQPKKSAERIKCTLFVSVSAFTS